MSTALVPVTDMERMAIAIAKSGLFGMKDTEQALALMLVAQAEGLHPATAARDYHIIQGRPALKSDAMLARYLNSGGKVEWHDHTDEKVAATFTHPAGGSLRIDWDMARAKKAGLVGKDNWTKYPRQMLRARVISEGVRATNPAVAVGVYTVEETQDFEPAKAPRAKRPEPKDVTDVDIPEEIGKDDRTETLKALCLKLGDPKISLIDILGKCGVESADKMTQEDYDSAKSMLNRKIAKQQATQA